MPQLPVISVVTPCRTLLWAEESMKNTKSEWEWGSMNPGHATFPLASTVVTEGPLIFFPMAAILPSNTAISPQNQGFPVPFTILAFWIITSNINHFPFLL
jgi:hypothetical protein